MPRPIVLALALSTLVIMSGLASAQESSRATSAKTLTVTVPSFANATCPITGKATSTAFFVDTDEGRIHACSPECASQDSG